MAAFLTSREKRRQETGDGNTITEGDGMGVRPPDTSSKRTKNG
jgi:hypothetical protein